MSRLFLSFIITITFCISLFAQDKDLGLNYILQENGYDGVIVLYDYENDKLFTSHMNKTDKRVLPASTFKIFNTLMFLDLAVVEDTSHVEKWDGKEYKHKGKKISAWCKDTNLADAFRNSTVWYYKKKSKAILFPTYKKLMKKNKYGKVYGKTKTRGFDFWNEGKKIGVSAKDQIKFLVKLKDYRLSFKPRHIDIVKELMVVDQTDDYIFRAKSGWTISKSSKFKDGKDIGWYVGYVEYKDNSYFFAVRLEKDLNDHRESFSQDRIDITKVALRHQFQLDIE